MEAVDCQGLGGGMTLGMVRAGWQIAQKYEQPGGFGFAQHQANAHLLGDYPMSDAPAAEWEVRDVPLVFGCPPCSGFSGLSIRAGGRDMRGVNAAINSCMWDFWGYVARVQPLVAAMESVQQAFSNGRPLMQQLHAMLEERTGKRWWVSHVLHNNLSVGGGSMRKRYFLVMSQLGPLGLRTPRPKQIPTLEDIMGDLAGLPLTMEPQPRIMSTPSWWAAKKADVELVTGHDLPPSHLREQKARIASICGTRTGWEPGEAQIEAVYRYWVATGGRLDEDGRILSDGQFPTGFSEKSQERHCYKLVKKGADWDDVKAGNLDPEEYSERWKTPVSDTRPRPFIRDMYQPVRWPWDRPGRVFSGGGMDGVVHPIEPRTFTYREAARLLGFPDSWNVEPYVGRESTFGKAVSVEAAYWLGYWLKNHLASAPDNEGLWIGDQQEDGSFVTNTSLDFKAVYNERTGVHEDARSSSLKKAMEARGA